MTNVDALYILVRDLLRGNTLTVFNNKQTMFESQSLENLKHCLNAVTVQVFPNKAYKLQKMYISHMMYKPRHISVCKWIARDIKLNNYLMEFPTPTGIMAKKLEDEEILEVLENGIPTSWNFQMDKEETCVCYKECKPKKTKESSIAFESYSKRGGKHNAKCKASKKACCDWDQESHDITPMSKDVTIASTM
eukprot:3603961-Ditylum_brightwellii.AAC.1